MGLLVKDYNQRNSGGEVMKKNSHKTESATRLGISVRSSSINQEHQSRFEHGSPLRGLKSAISLLIMRQFHSQATLPLVQESILNTGQLFIMRTTLVMMQSSHFMNFRNETGKFRMNSEPLRMRLFLVLMSSAFFL